MAPASRHESECDDSSLQMAGPHKDLEVASLIVKEPHIKKITGVQLARTHGESKGSQSCVSRGKLVSFRMDKQVRAVNSRSLAHLVQYMWPEHEVRMLLSLIHVLSPFSLQN